MSALYEPGDSEPPALTVRSHVARTLNEKLNIAESLEVARLCNPDRVDLFVAGTCTSTLFPSPLGNIAIGTVSGNEHGHFVDFTSNDWQPVGGLYIPRDSQGEAYDRAGDLINRSPAEERLLLGAVAFAISNATFDSETTVAYKRERQGDDNPLGIILPCEIW